MARNRNTNDLSEKRMSELDHIIVTGATTREVGFWADTFSFDVRGGTDTPRQDWERWAEQRGVGSVEFADLKKKSTGVSTGFRIKLSDQDLEIIKERVQQERGKNEKKAQREELSQGRTKGTGLSAKTAKSKRRSRSPEEEVKTQKIFERAAIDAVARVKLKEKEEFFGFGGGKEFDVHFGTEKKWKDFFERGGVIVEVSRMEEVVNGKNVKKNKITIPEENLEKFDDLHNACKGAMESENKKNREEGKKESKQSEEVQGNKAYEATTRKIVEGYNQSNTQAKEIARSSVRGLLLPLGSDISEEEAKSWCRRIGISEKCVIKDLSSEKLSLVAKEPAVADKALQILNPALITLREERKEKVEANREKWSQKRSQGESFVGNNTSTGSKLKPFLGKTSRPDDNLSTISDLTIGSNVDDDLPGNGDRVPKSESGRHKFQDMKRTDETNEYPNSNLKKRNQDLITPQGNAEAIVAKKEVEKPKTFAERVRDSLNNCLPVGGNNGRSGR